MPVHTLRWNMCIVLTCGVVLVAAVRGQEAGKLVLVAGNGKGGDGPASQAKLATPYGVGFDGKGNCYVGEIYGHKVRKIDPDGNMTTIAGTGEKGFGGDGGPAGLQRCHDRASGASPPRG